MTKTIGNTRAAVLLALVPAMVLAVAPWAAAPSGAAVSDLVGSGAGLGALLWTCGGCIGRAAILVSAGSASVVGWLATSANLAKMTACATACYAALTL